MDDYRDENSPDIALLLAVARAVRDMVELPHQAAIDKALEAFKPYATEIEDDAS
jgi:hypothetical protein